jgi:hypothetical protein
MNVEFISGVLAGATGVAHAERLLGPAGSTRGTSASSRAADGVQGPLETGDRQGDGRQPRGPESRDSLNSDVESGPPAPANSTARGQRLDLIA